MSDQPRSRMPGWFIALMVLGAAGITVWVVLRKKGDLSWLTSAQPASQALSSVGSSRAPVLRAGATAKHADLGPCTLCHAVVGKGSRAVPAIRASSSPVHQYRGGVCINCHQIAAGLSNSVNPVAGQANLPSSAPVAVQAPAPPAPARSSRSATTLPSLSLPARSKATQAPSWLGMSVAPISRETAQQLGIPQNLQGLVITGAQGEAAASGLRPGDVLISVGGVRMTDLERFSTATERGSRSGEILEVLRGGTLHKLFLSRKTATTPTAARAPPPPPRASVEPLGGRQ